MPEHSTRLLATAGTVTTSTATTLYAPLAASITLGIALTLIATLAMIATLARHKTRRDAARNILRMLLDFLRPYHAEVALTRRVSLACASKRISPCVTAQSLGGCSE